MTRRRVDIREAAGLLDTTVDAVRKRVQRGTLESEREDGRVYVWPDTDQDTGGTVESGALISAKDETIAALGERIASLEHQLETRSEEARRKDHIIAALTQCIPELPSVTPSEAQEAPDARENATANNRPREEERPPPAGPREKSSERP